MLKTKFQIIVVLAAGALLGYLAAAGNLSVSRSDAAQGNLTADSFAADRLPEGKPELLLAQANPKAAPAQTAPEQPPGKKPNIVVIWGDDVGQSDISAYSMGLMGFRTPNIDRVAKEG